MPGHSYLKSRIQYEKAWAAVSLMGWWKENICTTFLSYLELNKSSHYNRDSIWTIERKIKTIYFLSTHFPSKFETSWLRDVLTSGKIRLGSH